MKTILLGLILLFATAGASAQTAVVVEVKPEDTAQLTAAWNAKQKADNDWNVLQAKIVDSYVAEKKFPADVLCSGCVLAYDNELISGFGNDYEFSSDFKYIVPKAVLDNPSKINWNACVVPTTNNMENN